MSWLEQVMSAAAHPVLKNMVVLALALQLSAGSAIILWAHLTGRYHQPSADGPRQLSVLGFGRAAAQAPVRGIVGLAGVGKSLWHDCLTIRWYAVKLAVLAAALYIAFVRNFGAIGLPVLQELTKVVLIMLTVYAVRHTIFALIILLSKMPFSELEPSPYEPDVIVLIPCHNEQTVIAGLLTSLLRLDYPAAKLQIVVIDDSSTDETRSVVERFASQIAALPSPAPLIQVYHRPPGTGGKGKSAALNAAIEGYGFGEVIAVFDADHDPDPDCLRRMVRHYEDPQVGAFMGRCIPSNQTDSIISYFVYLEYVVGYRGDMFAREVSRTVPAFGGSNCSVRRSLLIETIGLFKEGCLAEDTELTMCVYEEGLAVRYDATARNYEEATANLSTYIKQRTRWARGHDQVSLAHSFKTLTCRKMTIRRRIEGFLFLQVYWMPIFYLLGTIVTFVDYFLVGLFEFPYWAWFFFVIGPTLEILAAFARDRQPLRSWLSLPLFPAFAAIGMYIATRAAWQELMGKTAAWEKTARAGELRQGARLG